MATTIFGEGWACMDCTILEAYGETPPEMTEEETELFLARIRHYLGRLRYHVGGSHENWCEGVTEDDECNCQYDEFSWTNCDVCHRCLGGARQRVTFTQPA